MYLYEEFLLLFIKKMKQSAKTKDIYLPVVQHKGGVLQGEDFKASFQKVLPWQGCGNDFNTECKYMIDM